MASMPHPEPLAQPTPPKGYKGTWNDIAFEEAEKARLRRLRVLAHPDIAKRLCDPPYRLASPEMWTGYVPPAQVPYATYWKPNDSPIRRQLIEILRAVAEREQQGGEQ